MAPIKTAIIGVGMRPRRYSTFTIGKSDRLLVEKPASQQFYSLYCDVCDRGNPPHPAQCATLIDA